MKPTPRQETGMALIVIAAIIVLLWLTSCSTKKTISEYVYVHDTLVTYHNDTISEVRYVTHTDTIREMITREIVLRQDTSRVIDTIRINTYYDRYKYVYVADSTGKYKGINDSTKAVVKNDKEKMVETRSNRPRWWEIGGFLIFVVSVIAIAWRIK